MKNTTTVYMSVMNISLRTHSLFRNADDDDDDDNIHPTPTVLFPSPQEAVPSPSRFRHTLSLAVLPHCIWLSGSVTVLIYYIKGFATSYLAFVVLLARRLLLETARTLRAEIFPCPL